MLASLKHSTIRLEYVLKFIPMSLNPIKQISFLQPIPLISQFVEISKGGKFLGGRTEIPFQVLLKPKQNRILYETYHGVFISIQYYLKCELKRPMLNKDIQKVVEFVVEYAPPPNIKPSLLSSSLLVGSGPATGGKPIKFVLTNDSLQNVKDVRQVIFQHSFETS